jgi:hypothetical protein
MILTGCNNTGSSDTVSQVANVEKNTLTQDSSQSLYHLGGTYDTMSNHPTSAIQLGGEPQKLNNIFGEKDPSGNYPFVNCGSVSGNSSDACNAMISSIVTYGKSMETQLTKPDGSIISTIIFQVLQIIQL